MSHSKRDAFTLVELLVVITIIGMLMALLLPAVNAATENARSMKCKNRLKQLATAVASYESRFQSFPGYVNPVEVPGQSEDRALSWILEIMGDLERSDIVDQWKRGDLRDNELPRPFLDMLVCPSDPPLGTDSAWTSYVANAGHAQADYPGCGIMHTRYPLHTPGSRHKKMVHVTSNLDTLSSGDGSSTTIMVTENIQASTWDVPSFLRTAKKKPTEPAIKNGVPHNVFVWHDTTNPSPGLLINSDLGPGSEPTIQSARPSSEHKGGVNVAFADGHVVFLKESIDYTVYSRLMSTDGEKCWRNLNQYSGQANIDHRLPLADTDYR